MKNKIYYLTRSYAPYQKGGGPLLRTAQVESLAKLGWEVIAVMPNYQSLKLEISNNIIKIPFSWYYKGKISAIFERFGIYEDYLDNWIKNAFLYLQDKINKEDIIFATSGGELGPIKLGSLLKHKIDCKFVIDFHDPIDYTLVNNRIIDNKFHVSREKQEEKYLSNADLIITSSKINQNSLISKYPNLKERIKNNYFGYVKKLNVNKFNKKSSNKLRIAYAGNMGILQKPEILYETYRKIEDKDNIEIYFIGDVSSNKKLKKIKDKNVKFIKFLPHNEFLEFMCENIDLGFVSLCDDYLGSCVPSKIYEYINLEIPIIGALPLGDGMDIININNYGKAYKYNDVKNIANAIKSFKKSNYLINFKINIENDKDKWHIEEKIKELNNYLLELKNGN